MRGYYDEVSSDLKRLIRLCNVQFKHTLVYDSPPFSQAYDTSQCQYL